MASFEKKLTAHLDRFAAEYQLPGYDCAVYHHHKEVYRHMSGVADLETSTPITRDTLYNLYSNTKVITCVAALQLYEQGYFQLEDELSRYFPEFAHMKVMQPDGTLTDATKPITIRDVFRMTAGFGDGGSPLEQEMGMKFFMETGGACPGSEFPKHLAQAPLRFEPGTQYFYGICHEMLAALISKFSGLTFGEYLQRHIFAPLGMTNTAFTLDKLENKALANQYRFEGKDKPLTPLGAANCLIPPILKESASGGLISSVDDYMKFQEALTVDGQLLHRNTVQLMRLDQLSGSQRDGYGYTHIGMGYGLGVRTIIDQAKCGSPVGFGPFGWGGATGSYGSIDPENELTFFYMQHVFDTDCLWGNNGIRNIIYSSL